jgi:hypothetical protein
MRAHPYSAVFAPKTTERKFVAHIVATRIPRFFAVPCRIALLLWWFAVQGVYARSIGSTFARPANDNALRGAL